jgi:hypothetical protein
LRIPDPTSATGYRMQPILGPTSFTKFDEVVGGKLLFKYLLSDANGCYQLIPNQNDPTALDVEWLITADDYYAMTGKRLQAANIRRLSSTAGNPLAPTLRQFLITNRFRGADNPSIFGITYNTTLNPANGNIRGSSSFTGEVFVLKPSTFNFVQPFHGYQRDYINNGANMLATNPTASIIRRIPNEQLPTPGGFIGFVQRIIGDPQRATGTQPLEQPSFADRPL